MKTISKNELTSFESLEARALLASEGASGAEHSADGLGLVDYLVHTGIGAASAVAVHKLHPNGHIPCSPLVYGTMAATVINAGIDYVADKGVSWLKEVPLSLLGAVWPTIYLKGLQDLKLTKR